MYASHRSGSLKTRSEAVSAQTASSQKSSARRRAQLSKLRAEQAQRTADAAIRHAQWVAEDAIEQARAEAQRAADQAKIDALEVQLLEEERESDKFTRRSVSSKEPSTRPVISAVAEPQRVQAPEAEDDPQMRSRECLFIYLFIYLLFHVIDTFHKSVAILESESQSQ